MLPFLDENNENIMKPISLPDMSKKGALLSGHEEAPLRSREYSQAEKSSYLSYEKMSLPPEDYAVRLNECHAVQCDASNSGFHKRDWDYSSFVIPRETTRFCRAFSGPYSPYRWPIARMEQKSDSIVYFTGKGTQTLVMNMA